MHVALTRKLLSYYGPPGKSPDYVTINLDIFGPHLFSIFLMLRTPAAAQASGPSTHLGFQH